MYRVYRKIRHIIYYLAHKNRFKTLSYSADIHKGVRVDGACNISISDHVIIQRFSWLGASPLTDSKTCLLLIGKGTVIGNFNHIYATRSIVIGSNVLFADRVYVSDCTHSYLDINLPVIKQPIRQLSDVVIGDGSWIGENVCVIGCKIGRNCVIGANSVVTSDIPDYCVAVGSPARIIKKFNVDINAWESVK